VRKVESWAAMLDEILAEMMVVHLELKMELLKGNYVVETKVLMKVESMGF
jgi:hypothetical protein